MSFSPYKEYKDSKVEWMGVVPAHWEVIRLKNILQQRITDGPHTTPEFVDDGVPFLSVDGIQDGELKFEGCRFVSVTDHQEFRRKALPQLNDLLMGKAASTGKIARVKVDFEFSIWSPLALIRLDTRVSAPGFYEQSLKSPFAQAQIENLCTANTQKNISMDDIPRLILTKPPLSEQVQISAFLDHETAKIDALVEEQQRLIELLQEKRQAVISHAVTKGLDPSVPMKNSGVPWMGKIPAHWEVTQSRRMFKVRSEPALETDKMLTASQKHGVLYQADYMELEGRKVVEVIKGIESLKHVEPDDFIISMRSFQGGIEWCKLQGSTSFHYVMLTPVKWVHPPFFAHLLKSPTYVQALRSTTDLIRDGQELRYSNFAQVDLIKVPLEEQKLIANYLDKELAKFDDLIEESSKVIEILQERRIALISAAVTGKIDVRNWKAKEQKEEVPA